MSIKFYPVVLHKFPYHLPRPKGGNTLGVQLDLVVANMAEGKKLSLPFLPIWVSFLGTSYLLKNPRTLRLLLILEEILKVSPIELHP